MNTQTQHCDVVFHVGAPKTGSSAIQQFCLVNRHVLANDGYYYPEHNSDSNGISGGHTQLGINIKNNKLDQAKIVFKEYLAKAKAQDKILLLSAESFYAHPQILRELTNPYKCRIISFFRDPAEFVVSIYNQSVKRHHNISTMEGFCKRILSTEQHQASGVIVYDWIEAFGKEAVKVLRYEKPRSADAKLERKFLTVLGVAETDQSNYAFPDKPINRGYTDAILEFKRRLNFVLDKDEKAQNHKIDHALQFLSDEIEGDEIRNSASQLVKNTYEMLNEKFKASNEKIRRDFFPGEPSKSMSSSGLLVESDAPGYSLVEFAEFVDGLERYDPEINRYIKQSIWKKLSGDSVNYYVLSLADIYGLPLDNVNLMHSSGRQLPPVIDKRLIKQFVDQGDNHAHLLESVATMLEQLGKLRPALALVRKAHLLDSEKQSISRTLNRLRKKVDVLIK